jgi:hypothetical protein
MIRHRLCAAALFVVVAWAPAACGGDERLARDDHASESDASVGAPQDPQRTAEDSALAVRNATLEPGALRSVAAEPVTLWEGATADPFWVTMRTGEPSSTLARRFGTITRQTALRERAPDLGQFPCTSCHLGRRIRMVDQRIDDAHQNIVAVHPVQTGGACATCHAPDNVELLTLRSGERATLDHTYRLCAQCHFAQADACADCHDPHRPALTPRIPFRAPQIERTPRP